MLEQLDWPTALAGLGTFLTTCYLTWKGWQDRKKEVATPQPAQLVAGVIQDNTSIRENTEAVRQLCIEVRRMTDIILITKTLEKDD